MEVLKIRIKTKNNSKIVLQTLNQYDIMIPRKGRKGRENEKMLIDFRTDARNSNDSGWVTVDSRSVFNFDGSTLEHNKEERDFLKSLTAEWIRIPAELLDETTNKNFICYARLHRE